MALYVLGRKTFPEKEVVINRKHAFFVCETSPCDRIFPSTYHVFDDLIFAVVLLDFKQMVAEIQDSEAPLLPEENDDHAASPVEPVTKTLPADRRQQNRRPVSLSRAYRQRPTTEPPAGSAAPPGVAPLLVNTPSGFL